MLLDPWWDARAWEELCHPNFDSPVSEDNCQSTPFLRACHSESSPDRLVGKQCCTRNALGTSVPLYLDVLCRHGPEEHALISPSICSLPKAQCHHAWTSVLWGSLFETVPTASTVHLRGTQDSV